ncbi:MAG TPA: NRDE family protein [candidate division Zixibacteria bacterium]|nr:NRDE family protein [candidate division Zixibacteria bacterium]
MCTLALYYRISSEFPLIVAANRDERYDRPSSPPATLGTYPAVVAGVDLRAGGTWLGANSHGLVAGILNRREQQAAADDGDARSRGLLCLELLRLRSAGEARAALPGHERFHYRPFVLVWADRDQAWTACNDRDTIRAVELTEGLHLFSNRADEAAGRGKVERARALFEELLPRLREGARSIPEIVGGLHRALREHDGPAEDAAPADAVCAHGEASGTVSSSIVLFAARAGELRTFYCPGPPCRNGFTEAPALRVE